MSEFTYEPQPFSVDVYMAQLVRAQARKAIEPELVKVFVDAHEAGNKALLLPVFDDVDTANAWLDSRARIQGLDE